jgi:hypothetical protein
MITPNHDYSRIPKQTFHNIAGNSSRFAPDLTIRLDQKWVNGLTRREKAIFSIFGGWMNWLLGYRFFGE